MLYFLRYRLISFDYLVPIFTTLLGSVLRFIRLDQPDSIVFDEHYYVKDAYSLGRLGYEAYWPDDATYYFSNKTLDVYYANIPGTTVHPPFGKWLIWLGMMIDPKNTFFWRLTTVISGCLMVLLTTLIMRYISKKASLALLAGTFMAIDPLAIVMSRTAILDTFLGLFILLAFGCLLFDRAWFIKRFNKKKIMWLRPWLIACMIILSLGCGIKWSAIYYIALYGIYIVILDFIYRIKQNGANITKKHIAIHNIKTFITFLRFKLLNLWQLLSKTKNISKSYYSMLFNAGLTLVIFCVFYTLTWTSWLITKGSWNRTWGEENPASGILALIPDAFRSLIYHNYTLLQYHTLLQGTDTISSTSLSWIPMLKPTFFYSIQPSETTIQAIASVANPVVWWAAWLSIIVFIILFLKYRLYSSNVALVLLGLFGGIGPWLLLYPGRITYFFYNVQWVAFVIMALVLFIGYALDRSLKFYRNAKKPERRFKFVKISIISFICLAVFSAAWFYPLATGIEIPIWFYNLHIWNFR